ncbi:MAG: FG-GAP-like repeat-containing protein, partial [Terriglobales bacterium]
MRSARAFGVWLIFLSTLAMAQTTAPGASIPTIEQPLVPTAAQPGGAGFTLTINGTGFVPTPTGVLFGGTTLTITSSTATQLKAMVPATAIAKPGTASVSVQTNISDLTVASNVAFFQIATPASPLFADPVDYSLQGNEDPVESVLVADLNGDGIPDLAVGVSNDPDVVYILFGKGDGTFAPPPSPAPSFYEVDDASSMVAGVFTNDGGSLDIAVGDQLLVNNGQGTFTVKITPQEGLIPIALGDFAQTGALDIAGNLDGTVLILNNDGEGNFSIGQRFGAIEQFGGLLTADFNGDGILDLAVLDLGENVVDVYLGATGTAGFNTTPVRTNIPGNTFAFTAADFNGDGKQDIALVYGSEGGDVVYILNGNGDGSFNTTNPFNEVLPPPYFTSGVIVTADFNEDGKLDLATGPYVLLGNGDGTFQTPAISNGGDAEEAVLLATGDFNGDGRPDLVTQDGTNGVEVAVILQQQVVTGAPVAALSPTSLTFTALAVGSTSASQTVTLSNTGNAALNISSISVGVNGYPSSDFSQTNNCGTSVAMGASCIITVSATPTLVGPVTASISITDNAPGSPQTVGLTGTGSPFSLTTSCTSLTVVPGQSAIFTVDLAPAGENSPSVTLACSGAPTPGSCTVSNITNPLNGATTAQVTATTMQQTGFLQPPLGRSNGNRMAGLVGLAGIAGLAALVVLPNKRCGKPGR